MASRRKQANNKEADELPRALWELSTKLRGVADLFKNQKSESLFSEAGAYGIGVLLNELAHDLENASESSRPNRQK